MKYACALLLAAAACTSSAAPQPLPSHFSNGDVRLAFTLDFPEGTPPFPAVVMGHGSGRMTRDQLRWASTHLTKLGFAVLRFDKRGVGESTGNFVFVGTHDSPWVFPQLAGDVAAGVRFLRTRPEIDPKRIGLVGNSQAGWILPIAAHELGDVAFMVLLAGPVCTVGQEMRYSEVVERTGRPVADGEAALDTFAGETGFDPVPVLRSVNTPTLWLLGLDDHSIPVQTTLRNLKTLASSGRPFEWRTYEGLDHALSPAIWEDVGRWLERFGARPQPPTFAPPSPSKDR